MKKLLIILAITLCGCTQVLAQECTPSFVENRVKATATADNSAVSIDCDLTLSPSDRITKRLIIEGADASNVTINCNGAELDARPGTYNHGRRYMIEVRSEFSRDGRWISNPQDVTIKNCVVHGAVRILGVQSIAELKALSRTSSFVSTVRNQAPRRIHFDDLFVTAVYPGTPFYVGVGVTEVTLSNSQLTGNAKSVAVYLDAESTRNVIRDNIIHTKNPREVMAIDASSHNLIINNRFSALNKGGIYLYRNCGERGVSRHTTPSHNAIVNNIFFYDKYSGGKPAVYIGSRNGKTRAGRTGYCNDDRDSNYGSGQNNFDFARNNVIAQNQIYKRKTTDMIKTRNKALNTNNYITQNVTVTASTVDKERLAGCAVFNRAPYFIEHGESTQILSQRSGQTCATRAVCENGVLNRSFTRDCRLSVVDINCAIEGNNNGCRQLARCPTNTTIVGARAACNLEFGEVANSAIRSIPYNTIRVLRASDKVKKGDCFVGQNSTAKDDVAIRDLRGTTQVRVGCKEHDKNGGDCHIRGALYCKSRALSVNPLPSVSIDE